MSWLVAGWQDGCVISSPTMTTLLEMNIKLNLQWRGIKLNRELVKYRLITKVSSFSTYCNVQGSDYVLVNVIRTLLTKKTIKLQTLQHPQFERCSAEIGWCHENSKNQEKRVGTLLKCLPGTPTKSSEMIKRHFIISKIE